MELKNTLLGIELGSTRIKAVLLDRTYTPLAFGAHTWENKLVDGVWTYSLEDARRGLQACFAELKGKVKEKYGATLSVTGAIGISAMMHGYLPFDRNGNQLAEFRTWRNTITQEAAKRLSGLFNFNIPQRWSIAHLYQAILNGESHVKEIHQLTTLAGYISFLLTGQRVIGIGDASGIFPIDSAVCDYDESMIEKFDAIHGQPWKLRDILPKVLCAGECGGYLTKEGARLLDPEGELQPGIPVAPCEGDAGTGMAATNSVRVGTGNVSAGTSCFAMLVAQRMPGVHREIDMVTTPAGAPVAMVHCNNCTSDINDWVSLFGEFADAIGANIDRNALFTVLFNKALMADADCGGLLSYNYFSGEGVTDLNEGRPVFLRTPDARFSLANFMRMHLLSALATLKIGLDILANEENLQVDKIYGHGGFFKTPVVGQRLLSAAMNAPVAVMETAGEGGAYGMALLCGYMLWKDKGESLPDFLDNKVFNTAKASVVMADKADVDGFCTFLERYKAAFDVERTAVEVL